MNSPFKCGLAFNSVRKVVQPGRYVKECRILHGVPVRLDLPNRSGFVTFTPDPSIWVAYAGQKEPTVTVTVRQLATWVEGEVVGDGERVISNARPLNEARSGDITFVEDEKYMSAWHDSHAAAAVVNSSVPVNGRPLIRVRDPLMAFAKIVQHLHGIAHPHAASIHPTACIHPTVVIGAEATVGPHANIAEGTIIGARAMIHAGVSIGMECRIGDDVALFPHVVLYDQTTIGNRVRIHANSVIGADGFGYRHHDGRNVKVPQLGSVEIADDVEIGACTTIDRGTFGATRIGLGTKIDNLVMIAHNCQIGKHNMLVSQVGIAGSTTTGDYVIMAGQVGVADHVHVGDRVQLGARAGIHKDVPADSRMLGAPATPDREQMRIIVSLEKLPELRKDIRKIKHHLGMEDE